MVRQIDPYQIPNTYLRLFFRYLGGDPALLAGTEQSPETLEQLEGTNSFHDYCRFFANARELLNEPAVGLILGEVNQLANMHGALSLAVAQSTDVRDCLQLLQRFIPLRNPAFKARLCEDGDDVGLEVLFIESAGEAHVPVAEAAMLSLTSVISVVSQKRVEPSRIELDYPRPAYAHRYPQAFHAASFRFSQPYLRLLVSRRDTFHRIGTDTDPTLRESVIRRCEELLQGVQGEHTTSATLLQIYAGNPGRLWTLRDVARHLNTSESTLQRRLAAEGTSYRKLHGGWLRGEAQKLLQERSLSVESIAVLMGYSDVSNFRCACRRWFGVPPQEYRNSLHLDGPSAGKSE